METEPIKKHKIILLLRQKQREWEKVIVMK